MDTAESSCSKEVFGESVWIYPLVCRGRCPHRPAGKLRIRLRFPQKRCVLPGRCGHRPLRLTAKSLRICIGLSLFAITCCDLSGAPAPVHRGQVHIKLTPSPNRRSVLLRCLLRTEGGAFRPSADTPPPVQRAGALRVLMWLCSCGTERRRV